MEFTLVITGSGRGLGRGIIEELLGRFRQNKLSGFPHATMGSSSHKVTKLRLILVSRSAKAQTTGIELLDTESDSIQITPIVTDIGTETGLEEAIRQIVASGNRIDALVNNAAVFEKTGIGEISWPQFSRVYFLNTYAPARMISGLLGCMNPLGAHILNIGSMGGIQGAVKFPGFSIYSSSKMALAGITECLATEMPSGVVINYLGLGAVKTEMLKTAFPGYEGGVSVEQMSGYVTDYLFMAPGLQNGSLIGVTLSNP